MQLYDRLKNANAYLMSLDCKPAPLYTINLKNKKILLSHTHCIITNDQFKS